jgi:hypothetical protein
VATRVIYALLGVVVCFAGLIMISSSHREIQFKRAFDKMTGLYLPTDEPPDVPLEKLVGTWNSGNYMGERYSITRKADGSFTATFDFRRRDTGPGPVPIVKVEGYWAVHGRSYSLYFTKSDLASWLKQPPEVMYITDYDATSVTFEGGLLENVGDKSFEYKP